MHAPAWFVRHRWFCEKPNFARADEDIRPYNPGKFYKKHGTDFCVRTVFLYLFEICHTCHQFFRADLLEHDF